MNPYAHNFKPDSDRPDPRDPISSRQGRGDGYNNSADGSRYTGGIKIEPPSPVSTDSRFLYGGNPTPINSGRLSDYWQPNRGSNLGDPRGTNRAFNEPIYEPDSSRSRMGEGSGYSTQDTFEHGAFSGQLPSRVRYRGLHEAASGSAVGSSRGIKYDNDYENASSNTYGGSSPTNTRGAHLGAALRHQADKPSVKHMTCWYWRSRGHCVHSDESCLYSHQDTGIYADRPHRIDPCLPSVAGRNAIELENKFTEQLKKMSRNERGEDQIEAGFAATNRIIPLEESVKTLGTKLEETARRHIEWGQQAKREHKLMNALSKAAKRGEVTDKDLEQIGAKMEARLREGEEMLNASAGDIVNVVNAVKRQLNVASFQNLSGSS